MTLKLMMHPAGAAPAQREVLLFRLGAADYALDRAKVQELRRCEAVTPIAAAPPHVLGVINLRAMILPVVDLRIRCGQAAPLHLGTTPLLLLNLRGRVIGIVVDAVGEIAVRDDDSLLPAEPAPAGLPLLGRCLAGGRLLPLLDADRLMQGDDAVLLAQLAA